VLYAGRERERFLRDVGRVLESVPWALLAPHEKQAHTNHGQTLERLAERGGLGIHEMVAIIEGLRYRAVDHLSNAEALERLEKHVAALP
jgi:hypothetical protein